MTFWWDEDNYGQTLQCYALQKYLRDAGHDAYLIRYDPRNDFIKSSVWSKIVKAFNPIELYKFLLHLYKNSLYKKRIIADIREKRDHPRDFDKFMDKYIIRSERKYSSYIELVENPPAADVYIVGSDQVWNAGIFGKTSKVRNIVYSYFLNFGDSSIKRVSYAASFGKEKEELDDDFIGVATVLLKKFDYISVREKSGLEICKQCGFNNAEWVPDPTLLLEKDIYRFLYRNEGTIRKSDKPYCFLYLVGNSIEFSLETIYEWAKSKNIGVLYVTANLRQDEFVKTYATIPEWIYLLEHAEYVITNSYHCTIFSLLFEKNFGIIPLIGKNTRFSSLFQLFDIGNRFISADFSILNMEIDWQSISNTFENIRNSCYFSKIIDGVIECL